VNKTRRQLFGYLVFGYFYLVIWLFGYLIELPVRE